MHPARQALSPHSCLHLLPPPEMSLAMVDGSHASPTTGPPFLLRLPRRHWARCGYGRQWLAACVLSTRLAPSATSRSGTHPMSSSHTDGREVLPLPRLGSSCYCLQGPLQMLPLPKAWPLCARMHQRLAPAQLLVALVMSCDCASQCSGSQGGCSLDPYSWLTCFPTSTTVPLTCICGASAR